MTTDATISIEALDTALAGAAPTLSDSEQRLAVTVYRALAICLPGAARTRCSWPTSSGRWMSRPVPPSRLVPSARVRTRKPGG
jgi:hypothetical protein